MREHLKKFLMAMAEHHVSMAKTHQNAMDGCEEGDGLHEFHKGAMQSHLVAGESCTECAKACDTMSRKADGGDELEPLPAGFSKVAPTRPGITMVPRAGERMPTRPTIDPDFAFLTKIETGQE